MLGLKVNKLKNKKNFIFANEFIFATLTNGNTFSS